MALGVPTRSYERVRMDEPLGSPEATQDVPPQSRGFERVIGVLAILIGGWIWEFVVTGMCHGYVLDGSASCGAGPFWPLAILWAGYPSKRGLAISGIVAFSLVAIAYGFVDLRSDAQAGIALAILLIPIPFASAIAYWIGLTNDKRRRRTAERD
jgi:hypothetical protein